MEIKEINKAEIIATFTETLAGNRSDLAMVENVLMSHGYVVISAAGIALDFTVADHRATNPKVSSYPGRVVRFTKADAQSLAAAVTDGNKNHATAVYVRDAIKAEIKNLEQLLIALGA